VIAHAGAADESLAIAMVFVGLWVGWVGWTRLRGTGFARLPRRAGFVLLGAAVAVAVASAFVPRAVFGPTLPVVATGPRITSSATVAFTAPRDGQLVGDDRLDVVLRLDGGTVVQETTRAVTADTGHVHLAVDGSLVSMTYGTVQSVDLAAYGPGQHVLEAEYVAADHLPFDPRVTASVTITLPGGAA